MARPKKAKADEMIYCDNRQCADASCSRWIKNSPMDVVIKLIRYELDKKGQCKNRME